MNTQTIITPKLLAASILVLSFLLSLVIIHVEAAANDSSINLKKDPGSGLFTLIIRDPDGIQEFSLSLVGRYSYGGGLSGCPKSFSSDYISLQDPSDFTPVMPAYIIDCNNNKTELEIPPPVDGVTKSHVVKKEVSSPPPPPPKEEKKEGLVPSPAGSGIEGPLSAEDIQYPVSGLGNCQNETECRSYCDNTDRAKECFAFAKKYNLISEEEAQKAADHFLNVRNGPGGCNSGKSCENYCNNVDHLDQCIAFAEETGYYSPEELAEARKFQALIKAGTQFPGDCKDRNSCEIYCGDPNHMEECLNFAETSGFMPPEEIAEAKKFMVLMRQGESPGGCTSKEQCETYCFEENHMDECIDFGLKAGVMTTEEAEMARKVGGKGPGGCRSKTQCEAYCEANSEECFNFAKEHGLMSEEDLQKMSKGMGQFRENLDKMPPEAVQCLEGVLGEENFEKIKNGQPIFDRGMEGKMKSCFGQMSADLSHKLEKLPPKAAECIKNAVGEEGLQKLQSGEFGEDLNFESLEVCFKDLQSSFGGGGNFGDGGFSGPGGCTTTEECVEYCTVHHEECQGFGPPGGGGGGPGGGFPGGPGGCTSQEECQAYCQSHPEECKNFSPPGGGGFPGGGATGGQFPGGGATGGEFPGGPGGCKSTEECITYCREHPEECKSFEAPSSGGVFPPTSGEFPPIPPGGGFTGGLGGCKSVSECTVYCQTHYTEPACGGTGSQAVTPESSKGLPALPALISQQISELKNKWQGTFQQPGPVFYKGIGGIWRGAYDYTVPQDCKNFKPGHYSGWWVVRIGGYSGAIVVEYNANRGHYFPISNSGAGQYLHQDAKDNPALPGVIDKTPLIINNVAPGEGGVFFHYTVGQEFVDNDKLKITWGETTPGGIDRTDWIGDVVDTAYYQPVDKIVKNGKVSAQCLNAKQDPSKPSSPSNPTLLDITGEFTAERERSHITGRWSGQHTVQEPSDFCTNRRSFKWTADITEEPEGFIHGGMSAWTQDVEAGGPLVGYYNEATKDIMWITQEGNFVFYGKITRIPDILKRATIGETLGSMEGTFRGPEKTLICNPKIELAPGIDLSTHFTSVNGTFSASWLYR